MEFLPLDWIYRSIRIMTVALYPGRISRRRYEVWPGYDVKACS